MLGLSSWVHVKLLWGEYHRTPVIKVNISSGNGLVSSGRANLDPELHLASLGHNGLTTLVNWNTTSCNIFCHIPIHHFAEILPHDHFYDWSSYHFTPTCNQMDIISLNINTPRKPTISPEQSGYQLWQEILRSVGFSFSGTIMSGDSVTGVRPVTFHGDPYKSAATRPRGWGKVVIQKSHPKIMVYSILVKTCSSIPSISVIQSLWNFAQSTAV